MAHPRVVDIYSHGAAVMDESGLWSNMGPPPKIIVPVSPKVLKMLANARAKVVASKGLKSDE
jgi:hypothetical protein